MNASKENAREANAKLDALLDSLGVDQAADMVWLPFIKQFLEAAARRLPTEAALEADKLRKKNRPRVKK
jgi:hypothetical protein